MSSRKEKNKINMKHIDQEKKEKKKIDMSSRKEKNKINMK